ncbi:MAG: hypothetical protein AB2L24_32325 [Mangrovibacterium sp.]
MKMTINKDVKGVWVAVRPPVVLDDVQNYDLRNVECEAFPNTEPKAIWDKQKVGFCYSQASYAGEKNQ